MIAVSPATLAYWEGLVLLGGFVAVVFWKLATGEMAIEDLLTGYRREEDGTYTAYESAGRVQTFLVTIGVGAYYVLQVIRNPHQFPDVPNLMVGTLAGSHAVYLGGKARALLSGQLRGILGRSR